MSAYPYRARRGDGRRGPLLAAAVLAGMLAASGAKTGHHAAPAGHAAAASGVAAEVTAYARAQLGRPYCWGGTGGGCYDCSGLAMMAWRSAGVAIQRTSQDQWATERHVPDPRPGDLVFFAGSDGTMTAPGHVGIVTGPGRMIEAYATGYPVRYASYARPDLVGFTDPRAGA